jgi:hypothetical protein
MLGKLQLNWKNAFKKINFISIVIICKLIHFQKNWKQPKK